MYIDRVYAQQVLKDLILDLMDKGCSPQDIIEGFENELDRFEQLVFDYE
jgi:chaperonin GroEL (HSP60 family)